MEVTRFLIRTQPSVAEAEVIVMMEHYQVQKLVFPEAQEAALEVWERLHFAHGQVVLVHLVREIQADVPCFMQVAVVEVQGPQEAQEGFLEQTEVYPQFLLEMEAMVFFSLNFNSMDPLRGGLPEVEEEAHGMKRTLSPEQEGKEEVETEKRPHHLA
jgi:hypothetical protein